MNERAITTESEAESDTETETTIVVYTVDGGTLFWYGVASGVFGGILVVVAIAVGVWHNWLGLWVRL